MRIHVDESLPECEISLPLWSRVSGDQFSCQSGSIHAISQHCAKMKLLCEIMHMVVCDGGYMVNTCSHLILVLRIRLFPDLPIHEVIHVGIPANKHRETIRVRDCHISVVLC